MTRIEELYAEYTEQDEYIYSNETVRVKKKSSGCKCFLDKLEKDY